jgi:hypothetical protein
MLAIFYCSCFMPKFDKIAKPLSFNFRVWLD